jgi:hypothetical protein
MGARVRPPERDRREAADQIGDLIAEVMQPADSGDVGAGRRRQRVHAGEG